MRRTAEGQGVGEGVVKIEQGRLPIDLNEQTKTSEPTRPPIGESSRTETSVIRHLRPTRPHVDLSRGDQFIISSLREGLAYAISEGIGSGVECEGQLLRPNVRAIVLKWSWKGVCKQRVEFAFGLLNMPR